MSLDEIKSLLKKMRSRSESDRLKYDQMIAKGADCANHVDDSGYRNKQFFFARGRIVKALISILRDLVENGTIVTYAGSFSEVTRWMDEVKEKEKEFNPDPNPDRISIQPAIKELRMHDEYPMLVFDFESVDQKKLEIKRIVAANSKWIN